MSEIPSQQYEIAQSIARGLADDIEKGMFTNTAFTTASTAEVKPLKIRDIWEARFLIDGLQIMEKSYMPENCIQFVAKDAKDVIWYNIDTGKMYRLNHDELMKDLYPEFMAAIYDPTR